MRLEQAETLKRLANLIAEKNKQHNLTSAKTPEEIYKIHINDCVQAFKKVQKTLRETNKTQGTQNTLRKTNKAVLFP